MQFVWRILRGGVAFAPCLGLLVSYTPLGQLSFAGAHRALYDPYTTLRRAPEPCFSYRAGLEPLISPSLSAIVAHCPTARAEDTDTTLFEKARVASGRLPLAPAAAHH